MNNKRLAVTRYGSPHGKPLCIIHGWGCDSSFLLPVAKMFRNRDVFLIDLPGYGMSKDLKNIANSLEDTALTLFNSLPKHCDVIAWSIGSIFTFKVANLSDSPIDKLVTICGTPRFPKDPNWPGVSYNFIMKCKNLLTPRRCNRLLKLFFRMQTEEILHGKDEFTILHSLLSQSEEIPFEVLTAGIEMMAYADVREDFKHIKIPCLHLFGRKDRFVPCALAQNMNINKLHQTFIFEHSAHSPYLTEPDLFYEKVSAFLEVKNLNS